MHNAAGGIKSQIKPFREKGENPKLKIWRHLTAGCLFGLHAGATILPGALLLSIDAENALAATKSSLQNSIAQSQIPIVPFELQNTPPQRFRPNPQFRIYRLGPQDSIGVVVPRFPELNGTFAIDGEGNVLLPLVGKLRIAGFTLEEAQ
ncbi:MAG TPA: hypothetical protein DCE56_31965, partial [Cyanobacteria bacterium UBA8553]|nr:hypothetical protein [Cyanobacteria bacterium UBA8553]